MFKQMSACQKADGNCFLEHETSADGEFMQLGTTITSEVYCETLKKLCRAIQNKRNGMLISGVMLLHDNSHPHTAAHT
jgi:hypothetical protein